MGLGELLGGFPATAESLDQLHGGQQLLAVQLHHASA
jgi:hypothetical protein